MHFLQQVQIQKGGGTLLAVLTSAKKTMWWTSGGTSTVLPLPCTLEVAMEVISIFRYMAVHKFNDLTMCTNPSYLVEKADHCLNDRKLWRPRLGMSAICSLHQLAEGLWGVTFTPPWTSTPREAKGGTSAS